jgi:hypothetical protein
MMKRGHPVANWVLVEPHEQRRALNRVLDFRDRDPDPNASGMPAAAVDHFWNEELPALLTRPYIRQLAQEQIAMLTAKAADLRHRIEVQAGGMQREAEAAEAEAARIASAMEASS